MDERNELQDLMDLLTEIGLPFAYDHFAEGESPDPPFITFLVPGSDNFSADGGVYLKVEVVHIELYTDKKVRDGKLRFVLQDGIGSVKEFEPGVFATPLEESFVREVIMDM